MVEFTHDVDMSETKAEFVNNGKIRTEAFVPLEVRLPKEKPEFAAPLKKLSRLTTCAGVPCCTRAFARQWALVVLPLAEGPVSITIFAPEPRTFWAAYCTRRA